MKLDMKRTILAIDSEVHMLKLLEQVIEEGSSYRIKTTHNALEVPEILSREAFSVIITEIEMPGFSGIDILKKIHDEERAEEVIILTAFTSLEYALEAFKYGASDFIAKPVEKKRLVNSVNRAMKRYEDKMLAQLTDN
ncbi:MAG: response regulator [Candidatus Zixiibacteriota bacterium]